MVAPAMASPAPAKIAAKPRQADQDNQDLAGLIRWLVHRPGREPGRCFSRWSGAGRRPFPARLPRGLQPARQAAQPTQGDEASSFQGLPGRQLTGQGRDTLLGPAAPQRSPCNARLNRGTYPGWPGCCHPGLPARSARQDLASSPLFVVPRHLRPP